MTAEVIPLKLSSLRAAALRARTAKPGRQRGKPKALCMLPPRQCQGG